MPDELPKVPEFGWIVQNPQPGFMSIFCVLGPDIGSPYGSAKAVVVREGKPGIHKIGQVTTIGWGPSISPWIVLERPDA